MEVGLIAHDLSDEQQALDDIVGGLDPARWQTPTPSAPWTVADQIAHLAYFDGTAALAITDPSGFARHLTELWEALGAGDRSMDELTLEEFRMLDSAELLDRWRTARRHLAEAAALLDEDRRVDWYGPSMGAKSFLTARLMEAWAHGQDVVDALGIDRPGTDRLRHIARLGFITRDWSYRNRGLEPPADPIRVELTAPSGGLWSYGPEDAASSVTGPALDFCLVVTQRRHVDDTALFASPPAREWLLIAQAFAGPATDGPAPRRRR